MSEEYQALYATTSTNGSPLGSWLNPDGEVSGFDYVMNASNMEEFRERSFGLFMQLAIIVIIVYIFAWGAWRSLRSVIRAPYGFASWCCFIQALAGLLVNLINTVTKISSWPICRHQIQIDAVGLAIGRMTINALLLSKAYYANGKNKKMLAFGIIAILPEPATAYVLMALSEYAVTPTGSCSIYYPDWFPWMYSALDVPIHTIFSIAFISVVIRQYRALGSGAWNELRKNSVTFLAGIVVFKIFMLVLVASKLAGDATATLGLIEWVVCSCLIVHQHDSVRRAFKRSQNNSPTSHYATIGNDTAILESTKSGISYIRRQSAHSLSPPKSPPQTKFSRSYAVIREVVREQEPNEKDEGMVEAIELQPPFSTSPRTRGQQWRRPDNWN
jgi:hypothetical protein